MTETARFYLHGLPGSNAELDFALPDWRNHKDFQPLNRLHKYDTHSQSIATMAAQIANYEKAHLIGFSLGGMSALKLAASLPETVVKLDLIAPAAPLSLGDFLGDMAGKPIFEAAMKGRLGLLTSLQAIGVKVAPNLIIKAMFANAGEADRKLLSNPVTKAMLHDGLRHCLIDHTSAYKDELRAFVQPWADILNRIACPVTIWHGTADTWAPFGLSEALRHTLGDKTDLRPLNDLSHYSALRAALPKIISD